LSFIFFRQLSAFVPNVAGCLQTQLKVLCFFVNKIPAIFSCELRTFFLVRHKVSRTSSLERETILGVGL
jgi:hypothetical protein